MLDYFIDDLGLWIEWKAKPSIFFVYISDVAAESENWSSTSSTLRHMPDDTTEGAVEHSSRLQPSINLHAPVTRRLCSAALVPNVLPRGMKARVSKS